MHYVTAIAQSTLSFAEQFLNDKNQEPLRSSSPTKKVGEEKRAIAAPLALSHEKVAQGETILSHSFHGRGRARRQPREGEGAAAAPREA